MVDSGAHKKVLVIGADAMSRIIDYTDRATCVIFGDGAGAVLIEPAEDEIGLDRLSSRDRWLGRLCALHARRRQPAIRRRHETVDKKMHFIHQDGQAVFKYRRAQDGRALRKLLQRNGFTGSDMAAFIPHQANKRIITSTADRLRMNPESVIINIDRYGNTTAGDHSPGHGDSHRTGQAQEGRSGAAGGRRRRIHYRGDAAALGVLRSLFYFPAGSLIILLVQAEGECPTTSSQSRSRATLFSN